MNNTREEKQSLHEWVDENRSMLVELVQYDDDFVRTLALAALLAGGDKTHRKLAIRELQLLEEVGEEWR